jgi:prolyl 4-hydroxylase
MVEEVYQEKFYASVYDLCEIFYSECNLWAAAGHCHDESKPFMQFNCAAACQSCEIMDYKYRCPINKFKPFARTKPGQINAMFERITTDPYWEAFGPVSIISCPNATDNYPWVITLDNFVSEEECEELIKFGTDEKYERSKDVGDLNDDSTVSAVRSTGRTSKNAWCPDECSEDPITGSVHRRIEKLADVHCNNCEYIQLLSYEEGDFYENHHGENNAWIHQGDFKTAYAEYCT